MKTLIFIFAICYQCTCISQTKFWELSGGIGLSGVNQIIKNNVEFDNYIFFNKKNNLLDNKFRNNILHTGYISISRGLSNNKLNGFRANLSFALYSFSSVYYKEEKFSISFGKNDTINTPNWLREKYSLPFIELGISKKFKFNNYSNIEIGLFCSYMIELYETSQVILLDSVYYQWERQKYTFYKEYPNNEFEDINYGVKVSLILFPLKKLYPIIQFTQSLNDISKNSINIHQHANVWSLHIGLIYNFYPSDIGR